MSERNNVYIVGGTVYVGRDRSCPLLEYNLIINQLEVLLLLFFFTHLDPDSAVSYIYFFTCVDYKLLFFLLQLSTVHACVCIRL